MAGGTEDHAPIGLLGELNGSVGYADVGTLPGAEIVCRATLNQGLVRFLAPDPGATPADHDARTDEVIARINRSGAAMFGGVTWHGRRAMRVSLVNWRTTTADVDRTVAAVMRALSD